MIFYSNGVKLQVGDTFTTIYHNPERNQWKVISATPEKIVITSLQSNGTETLYPPFDIPHWVLIKSNKTGFAKFIAKIEDRANVC